MRRKVSAIKAHALNHVQLVGEAAALLNGDDALPAYFIHCVGDQFGDGLFVGGERGHAGHLLAALNGHGLGADLRADLADGLVNAGLQRQGIGAGGHVHETALDDGARQHHGRGRSVAHDVVGLGGGLFDNLRAHVLVRVWQFDLFGDGDAVAANHGQGPHAAQNHVSPAGAQRKSDHATQLVNAAHQALSGVFVKNKLLFRHCGNPPDSAN